MNPVTVYIVEDEPRARANLRRLVQRTEELLLLGSAADGEAALADLDELRPELVFMDIQMPRLSGIELARKLPYRPVVIFTTAHDEYAVTAFELEALDYLLKPFGPRLSGDSGGNRMQQVESR